jgi:hypothetical protein
MSVYLAAELLKEAKYTITEFTMNNRKKLSEFAGLEVELPKIELPEPNVDISSNELQHDGHDIEADDEGAMVKADLYKLAKYSVKLFKKIEDEDQFEAWVQAKITKAADYISSVYHYLEYEMKFSEYGDKIENSDMYSESEKRQMKNALMEARKTLAALKIDQADKLDKTKTVKESVAHTCGECGGSGMVEKPLPEATKAKVDKYNRETKAYAAAKNRMDKNRNGIPDSMEQDADGEDFGTAPKKSAPKKGSNPFAKKDDSESKKSAPKKGSNPFAKKSKDSDSDCDSDSKSEKPKSKAPKKEKSEKDDSKTESMFGGSVYGESVTPVKKPSGVADKKGGNPFAKKDDDKKDGGKEFGKALDKAKSEWNTVKESAKQKAKKDYDKDGKVETGEEEHKGSVGNAIKASKEKECIKESVELSRLREITLRVLR